MPYLHRGCNLEYKPDHFPSDDKVCLNRLGRTWTHVYRFVVPPFADKLVMISVSSSPITNPRCAEAAVQRCAAESNATAHWRRRLNGPGRRRGARPSGTCSRRTPIPGARVPAPCGTRRLRQASRDSAGEEPRSLWRAGGAGGAAGLVQVRAARAGQIHVFEVGWGGGGEGGYAGVRDPGQ